MLHLTISRAAEPDWAWVGAVTTNTAVLRAGWSEGTPGPLWVQVSGRPQHRLTVQPQVNEAGAHGEVATYKIDRLPPNQSFEYGWGQEVGGAFQSFPEGQADFTFAFSSCSDTGSNHPVFDEILRHKPLFFLHAGDLHYEDIRRNDVNRFRHALRRVLGAPRQNSFFRSLPVIYIWDDHDYGPNDSDRESPSREAAMDWYRGEVPHFPLALGDDPQAPVAQAFSVGRVRFILTDLRSARHPKGFGDQETKTMMGEAQLAWFKKEVLEAHRTHALVIWMAGVPWIAGSSGGADHWGGYSNERRIISDFLVENNITNFCTIAGDAHMLAYDDGSNNNFATDGKGPGFPVYQAAALDRNGSRKGGPYSGGTMPGRGQFGLMRIQDRGPEIEVSFEGRNQEGNVLMQHSFTRSVPR